jgi:DNA-binding GntR family transcriptional regulator
VAERTSSNGPGPRPVARRSVVDLVIDEVRRSIMAGELPPGSPVSIAELSARLDVSHIPVREALRRLESEGLIELRRSRSAVVAPLSREDLESVFHLRGLLEADVMARAVKRYTDADLAVIETAWEALRVRPDDDVESFAVRHADFHRVLLAPAATQWDERLLDITWTANDRYLFLILGEITKRSPTDARDAHLELLDAARAGSARAARRAVQAHLASGIDLIGPALEQFAAAGPEAA